MDALFIVIFGLLMIKLAEEVATGLQNTLRYNHVDDYWMVPAFCIVALGAIVVILG